jgi:hypothetical protein
MRMSAAVMLGFMLLFLTGCQEPAFGVFYGVPYTLMMPVAIAQIPARQAQVRQENRLVTLAGSVMDENGNELAGAQLLVSYLRLEVTTLGTDTDYLETLAPLEPHFSVDIPGRINQIQVLHQGCYSRTFWLNGNKAVLSAEAGHEIRDAVAQDLHDLRIVLRKHGTFTMLDRRLDTIWLDAKVGGEVLAPDKPATDWQSVLWVEDVEKAPANHFYVSTTRTAEGIPTTPVTRTDGDMQRRPAEIRLGVTGSGNGIMVYEPKEAQDAWYEMRQAPASGYQQEVTLDAVARRHLVDYDPVYFFIKCGNQYGRGSIHDADMSRQSATIFRFGLRIVLEMQPDGTGNLEEDPETSPFGNR